MAEDAITEVTVELAEVNCGECGGVYAISERYRRQKKEKGGFWTCPYCRTGWGYGEGELERERKRRHQAEQRARLAEDARQDALRREAAAKGQLTKARKRMAAGVCPCCNRTFKQVTAHMRRKHPEFLEGVLGQTA
ncbi:MAG: hypothetical protein V2J02_18610 [Pseudomonadales bacterium]|jgi:phage/plasmid primase-like uncharacterized protein|nr:hypothetical protein [Pseudomonadales bacterium]